MAGCVWRAYSAVKKVMMFFDLDQKIQTIKQRLDSFMSNQIQSLGLVLVMPEMGSEYQLRVEASGLEPIIACH